MAVILNETKQAKSIIETGRLGKKTSSTLFLLGKYYRQKEQLDEQRTMYKLNAFMQHNTKNYNPILWETMLEHISNKAATYPLREIDYIGITQAELDTIATLKNKTYQALLFTMLCYAKLYAATSEHNIGWVNTSVPELFKTARVTVKHRNDKFLYLNDLEQSGLISFANTNDNLNLKVNFIDLHGENVLKIDDFRELGYEYQKYTGYGKFIRCSKCRRLIRQTSPNIRYCSECRQERRLEAKRDWWAKNRHSIAN